MRLMAMHTCPLLTKAAKNSFDATARESTSPSTRFAKSPAIVSAGLRSYDTKLPWDGINNRTT
jgi:hypothetical protein